MTITAGGCRRPAAVPVSIQQGTEWPPSALAPAPVVVSEPVVPSVRSLMPSAPQELPLVALPPSTYCSPSILPTSEVVPSSKDRWAKKQNKSKPHTLKYLKERVCFLPSSLLQDEENVVGLAQPAKGISFTVRADASCDR